MIWDFRLLIPDCQPEVLEHLESAKWVNLEFCETFILKSIDFIQQKPKDIHNLENYKKMIPVGFFMKLFVIFWVEI